ncbi:CD36 family, partial [Trinorchestia longiramus]
MKICIQFALCTIGLVFIVCGTVLIQQLPAIMDWKIGPKLVISPDSPTIDNFIAAPIPIYMQFYFFNVTNTQSVLAGGKPALQQIGPFTYLEKRRKHDLNWTDDTVEYLENTKYFFVPEMSNGLTEDVPITTLNPILISVASKLANIKTSVSSAIHAMFELARQRFDLTVFITRKTGELLFKGYEENFLIELSKFTRNPMHETGKFGFFYQKNDSDGGKYSIFTGSSGLDLLQVIDEFKNMKALDYWSNPYCDMINGTTGSQFPQPVDPLVNISMFSSDLCRSLYLSFEKKLTHGGLGLFRYNLPYEVLSKRPENECFCISQDDFTCKASLVNLSPCRGGSPVVVSTPHFYMGDEELITAVNGLHPNKDEHETYLDIEPHTGVSFRAMKRIQFNMPLKPYADLPDLVNVTSVIFPIFWMNESAVVPEARASQLQEQFTTLFKISYGVSYSLYAVGIICVIAPIIFIIAKKHKAKKAREQSERDALSRTAEAEPLAETEIHSRNNQND